MKELAPVSLAVTVVPSLEERSRLWVERPVEEALIPYIRQMWPQMIVLRQYKGWEKTEQGRALLIPDVLLVDGNPWRHVVVIEIKARRASSADAVQLKRYVDRARRSPGNPVVTGVLAAPSFSAAIPDEIVKWQLSLGVRIAA